MSVVKITGTSTPVISNCQEWEGRAGREESSGWIHLSTQMADSSPFPGPANQLMKFWHLGKGQTFQNHTLLWLLKDDFPTHMKEDNMPEAKLGYRHVKCEAYDTFMSQTPLTS